MGVYWLFGKFWWYVGDLEGNFGIWKLFKGKDWVFLMCWLVDG